MRYIETCWNMAFTLPFHSSSLAAAGFWLGSQLIWPELNPFGTTSILRRYQVLRVSGAIWDSFTFRANFDASFLVFRLYLTFDISAPNRRHPALPLLPSANLWPGREFMAKSSSTSSARGGCSFHLNESRKISEKKQKTAQKSAKCQLSPGDWVKK